MNSHSSLCSSLCSSLYEPRIAKIPTQCTEENERYEQEFMERVDELTNDENTVMDKTSRPYT